MSVSLSPQRLKAHTLNYTHKEIKVIILIAHKMQSLSESQKTPWDSKRIGTVVAVVLLMHRLCTEIKKRRLQKNLDPLTKKDIESFRIGFQKMNLASSDTIKSTYKACVTYFGSILADVAADEDIAAMPRTV